MPCEHYKDALIEAVASGVTPQGELRAHLENCDSCRSALASEQALFFFIDEGLRANANTEVPATLLPRLRVRLNEEHSRARSWSSARLLLACAAAVVFVLFITPTLQPPRMPQRQANTAAKMAPSPTAVSPSQTTNLVPALPLKAAHSQLKAASNRANASASTHPLEPEVLVPYDQASLLAAYQQEWMSTKRAPLVAQNPSSTTLTPLEVEPIQIARLDVKLMVDQYGE